jgi:hypothetical protein
MTRFLGRSRGYIGAALGALLALAVLLAPALAQFADQATWLGNGAGSANAQTITVPNATNMADLLGVKLVYVPQATNSGPATINPNSLGAQSVRKLTNSGLQALTGFELVTNQPVMVMWDGTFFDILSAGTPVVTVPTPQGYLTPCQVTAGSPVSGCTAGNAIQTGDVVSATNLYYEPFVGGQIPINNGSVFVVQPFSELTLSIPSSRLANTIYDVCITTTAGGVYSSTGSPTAVFSVAWTTSTAGSGARGSGAGTAQITQVNGIWVNAVQISGVNGASTYTIPANGCTIVATVLIDGTAGQITNHLTWGQSRKWSVANIYNTRRITLQVGDSTASWTYTGGAIRPSNNNTANKATFVLPLISEPPRIEFLQETQVSSSNLTNGIGFNSTSAYSGTQCINGSPGAQVELLCVSSYTPAPFIGQAVVTSLENSNTGSSSQFLGTQPNMLMTVQFGG